MKTTATAFICSNAFSHGLTARAILVAVSCAIAVGVVPRAWAVDMNDDVNPRTLANFTFEGLPLGSSVSQMKKQFPAARAEIGKLDRRLGCQCYVVEKLKTADAARFSFVDDKLYQIEVTYKEPRLLGLGGIEMVLRRLVDMLGAADHAGESRWTWQQPNCNRRADLFGMPDGALLLVSELNLVPIVEQRNRRLADRDDLGF